MLNSSRSSSRKIDVIARGSPERKVIASRDGVYLGQSLGFLDQFGTPRGVYGTDIHIGKILGIVSRMIIHHMVVLLAYH